MQPQSPAAPAASLQHQTSREVKAEPTEVPQICKAEPVEVFQPSVSIVGPPVESGSEDNEADTSGHDAAAAPTQESDVATRVCAAAAAPTSPMAAKSSQPCPYGLFGSQPLPGASMKTLQKQQEVLSNAATVVQVDAESGEDTGRVASPMSPVNPRPPPLPFGFTTVDGVSSPRSPLQPTLLVSKAKVPSKPRPQSRPHSVAAAVASPLTPGFPSVDSVHQPLSPRAAVRPLG